MWKIYGTSNEAFVIQTTELDLKLAVNKLEFNIQSYFNDVVYRNPNEKDIERANINIQLELTCIDTDIYLLIRNCIHNKLTPPCVMRVRDPVDYSSLMLGVLCSVQSCYRSLNRGAIAAPNYCIGKLKLLLKLGSHITLLQELLSIQGAASENKMYKFQELIISECM